MSRLIDSFEQILDGSGNPLEFGLLDFFVSGSSDVRKKTYADAAETIENTNPVVVGGDGRCPNVFGTGTYNVILRTSAGAQLLARDPVGGSDSLTFGADWVASTSYSATDQVRDDGNYWQSVTNLNQGNQPSLNDGSNWLKTDFLNITVNTLAIAANSTAIALKYDKTGGELTGQATSTAGDFNLVVNTALSDAAATLTAAQLIGGEFTITPSVARIQTLDTAANIISVLSGSVDGSNFTFTIVNLANFDVTIATAAGVSLVGNMIINEGTATFRVRRLSGSTVSVTRLEKANFSTGIMIVRDEKSNGTDGGDFSSGAWTTRDLNDVTKNTIVGASLGAANNRITLPAGSYLITASAPALAVVRHKIKLANITDSSDALIGSSGFSTSATDVSTRSFIDDTITIAAEKVFEIQHRCSTTKTGNGLGNDTSFGAVEVYTMIKIEKIG
tara:strand:+ start:3320 stop:4657 length:1338 start_codon:yes stop_codon:yes gene_type:complete